MRRTLFLTLSLIFLVSAKSVFAEGYKIQVELPYAANQSVQLTYHYLDKIYPSDTIWLNNKGIGTFEGDSLLTQGLYMIMISQSEHFDFLLGADQQFSLSNTTTESKTMKIEGAKETEAFVDYLVYLDDLKAESQQLADQYKSATPEEKENIRVEMKALDSKMKAYWETVGEKLPGSFLYKFLIANEVPQLDTSTLPAEIQQNDSLLLLARFNYQREHFWDNFDYTDERMLYTPLFKPKLETWFNKVLYPAYDSVKPYVYDFLDQVESNPRIFQFAASSFINGAINSNVMGMDALFIDLANDYYLNGKAFWASESSLDKIRENVIFIKDNLIGNAAPELIMENYDGEFVDLYQVDAKVTVVLIFEPNCGHCKVFVPEFHEKVYEKYKDKGLQVYAIYSMDDKDEWTEFLIKHKLFDWINVWDPDNTTRYKIRYDARVTPGVYVLNENKKIIAKKTTVEQLLDIMNERFNP